MKLSAIIRISIISIITTIFFAGCASNQEKSENATENVIEAKEELREVNNEIKADEARSANAEEWQAFKKEAEEKIIENEKRILKHKEKMKKSGNVIDAMYEKRISSLQEKNRELKAKLDFYENNQSDWEEFKTEFNRDMNELGNSFKDLTIDNK